MKCESTENIANAPIHIFFWKAKNIVTPLDDQ